MAEAPDPSWLPWLSVGGPIVTFLAIVGGGIKWWVEYRKNRVSTGLVDAQTDQTIVSATKDLIAIVREEMSVLKRSSSAKDRRINQLEAALTASGIPIPLAPPDPTPTTTAVGP